MVRDGVRAGWQGDRWASPSNDVQANIQATAQQAPVGVEKNGQPLAPIGPVSDEKKSALAGRALAGSGTEEIDVHAVGYHAQFAAPTGPGVTRRGFRYGDGAIECSQLPGEGAVFQLA